MIRPLAAVLAALALVAGCTSTDDNPATDPEAADGGTTTTAVAVDGPAPPPAGGRTYEATIRRTTGNVPHVHGATFADAAFGQGWASHEDHACALAEQLIRLRGEQARWFGPGDGGEHVDEDVAWRHLGIHERAVDDWAAAPPEVVEIFEPFAAGWNARHAEVGADGVSGWCAGAEWLGPVEPVDVYAYSRAVVLNASGLAVLDLLGTAQPPGAAAPGDEEAGGEEADDGAALAAALGRLGEPAALASNGWAIGAERSETGGGMLLANPHYPWEGPLRFWEVHLTTDDGLDVYGGQLLGLPGVGIGVTPGVAWTHTVSAGNRFTAYRLDLVEGDPTTYRYGDGVRTMESTDVTVEVLGDDGTVGEATRTVWRSHHGPVLDVPGLGWSDTSAIAYRDANLGNDEFPLQYRAMNEARDLDELIAAHDRYAGVPFFNTVAVGADGRAWYADTSATPALSEEAIADWEAATAADPVVALAAESRLVLLDGSTPATEWREEPGARDPGLVPFDEMPQVLRTDVVFNANDSFWLPHPTEVLEGDYSPLHGPQRTGRSPRTRQNAVVLGDTSPDGPAGADGRFSLDELAAAALDNAGFTAQALRDDLVARCPTDGLVEVAERREGDAVILPAATVDVAEACAVLAAWDGHYDLDSLGAVLWREVASQFPRSEAFDAGAIWAEPFDPDRPVRTPSGLAPPPADGPDPVLVQLARAVQLLERAGIAVDAPLGDVQLAPRRDGVRVPVHGGTEFDGVTNKVGRGGADTREPIPARGERLAPWSDLTADGYAIANGTSLLMAVAFGDDGPEARVMLTYGNTGDRDAAEIVAATERFSTKTWRTAALSDEAIAADLVSEVTVAGG
jgi:acyl-homoserine-lactone acylase